MIILLILVIFSNLGDKISMSPINDTNKKNWGIFTYLFWKIIQFNNFCCNNKKIVYMKKWAVLVVEGGSKRIEYQQSQSKRKSTVIWSLWQGKKHCEFISIQCEWKLSIWVHSIFSTVYHSHRITILMRFEKGLKVFSCTISFIEI